MTTASLILIGLIQALLLLVVAPLFSGFSRVLRAKMHNRRGPSIFQNYRDSLFDGHVFIIAVLLKSLLLIITVLQYPLLFFAFVMNVIVCATSPKMMRFIATWFLIRDLIYFWIFRFPIGFSRFLRFWFWSKL